MAFTTALKDVPPQASSFIIRMVDASVSTISACFTLKKSISPSLKYASKLFSASTASFSVLLDSPYIMKEPISLPDVIISFGVLPVVTV